MKPIEVISPTEGVIHQDPKPQPDIIVNLDDLISKKEAKQSEIDSKNATIADYRKSAESTNKTADEIEKTELKDLQDQLADIEKQIADARTAGLVTKAEYDRDNPPIQQPPVEEPLEG